MHRPLYFMVPFWGQRYREYFADLCLPSLLAPGNLPRLKAEDGHRFLIATTADDWAALERLPILERLARHAQPQFIDIGETGAGDSYLATIGRQTLAQRKLVEAAYRARTYGSLLVPDVIYSDGMVAALLGAVADGEQLVLCAALRQSEEPLVAELEAKGFLAAGRRPSRTAEALAIPQRTAADLAVRHLHPEVAVFESGHRAQPFITPFRFWRMPGGRGILVQAYIGAPLLMDFACLGDDHAQCLDATDFERIYVNRNFARCERIRVIRDSDEFSFLSLTPQAVNRAPPPHRGLAAWAPGLYRRLGARATHEFYVARNDDHVSRALSAAPVRWHADDLDAEWRAEERRVEAEIEATAGARRSLAVALLLRYEVLRARFAQLPLVLRTAARALHDPAARREIRRGLRVLRVQLSGPSSAPTLRNARD